MDGNRTAGLSRDIGYWVSSWWINFVAEILNSDKLGFWATPLLILVLQFGSHPRVSNRNWIHHGSWFPSPKSETFVRIQQCCLKICGFHVWRAAGSRTLIPKVTSNGPICKLLSFIARNRDALAFNLLDPQKCGKSQSYARVFSSRVVEEDTHFKRHMTSWWINFCFGCCSCRRL